MRREFQFHVSASTQRTSSITFLDWWRTLRCTFDRKRWYYERENPLRNDFQHFSLMMFVQMMRRRARFEQIILYAGFAINVFYKVMTVNCHEYLGVNKRNLNSFSMFDTTWNCVAVPVTIIKLTTAQSIRWINEIFVHFVYVLD